MKTVGISRRTAAIALLAAGTWLGVAAFMPDPAAAEQDNSGTSTGAGVTGLSKRDPVARNGAELIAQGRETFRLDTFGDEVFWGEALRLHEAIEGSRFGGVGGGLTPRVALTTLGLKVDADALPRALRQKLRHGQVDLDDVAVTLALIREDAVLGVRGQFNPDGSMKSVGITCALCHSTVDDSVVAGVGTRLDGWANRDLNVGAIIALAPNLQPLVDLLKVVHPTIDATQVRAVLNSWGPGKFDAELILDGKNAPTLIPNAYDMAGFNQHTWTGDWGTATYWNAFVAVLEMHGVGNFFDPRLDDADKFPIAAAKRFGHVSVPPDLDRVTSKLPALHVYQLALPAPTPRPGVHFDAEAAERGDELFSGKAGCAACHVEPLWTEPGWNLHTPDEMKIDAFQADRAPGGRYKTMNLAGLFVRELGLFMRPENKGRFYHDGRFLTLRAVVTSYNERFGLGLTEAEKGDLVEYLKSL